MKIYDNRGTELLDINVDDNSYRFREVAGDHYVTLYFSLAAHIEIPVHSYIDLDGIRYTLLDPENIKMQHTRGYEYAVTFDAPEGIMSLYKFRNPADGSLIFPLTAKPVVHLQMLVDNLNMRDSGWSVGECESDDEITVSYNHVSCVDALGLMMREADTESEIVGKTVSLRRVSYYKHDPLAMSYGKNKGFLPGVGRTNYGGDRPLAAVFAQGGERNIDFSKYGSQRLLLPKGQSIRYDGTYFEGHPSFSENNAVTYTSDASGYSVRRANSNGNVAEGSLDCTEIYPKREGVVSSVIVEDASKNLYDFIDNTIPEALDYNDYIINDTRLSIIFQSGALTGREFEASYVHKDRRFLLVPSTIDGLTMPGDNFLPAEGDKYAVFNVALPDAYIGDDVTKTGASWDMMRKCVKHLYVKEQPTYSFAGEVDTKWAKRNWATVKDKLILGGHVSFSADFQPEPITMRISAIKTYIAKPYALELTLSESIVVGTRAIMKSLQSREAYSTTQIKDLKREVQVVRVVKTIATDAETKAKEASDKVDGFGATVSELNTKVGDLERDFEGVVTTATNAEVKAKEASDKVDSLLGGGDDITLKGIKEQLDSIDTEIDGIDVEIEGLSTQIAQLDAKVDAQGVKIINLDAGKADKDTVTALEGAIGNKAEQSEVDELSNDVANLAKDVQANKTNISTNSDAIRTLNTNLNNKVDKITGKGLSTNDFTNTLKTKLESLSNYDDTGVNDAIAGLQSQLDALTGEDTDDAINKFNEIVAFLEGIEESDDLNSIIASIEQQIAGKANLSAVASLARQVTAVEENVATKADAATVKTQINSITDRVDAHETDIQDLDNNKVDKEDGKGLSTNDYTTTEKNKLAGIAAGAQVNVQSDWSVTDTNSDAFIKNKPAIPTKTSDLTNDSNFATTSGVTAAQSTANTALSRATTAINTASNAQDTANSALELAESAKELANMAQDLTGELIATSEEFTFRPSASDTSIRDESAFIKRIKGNTVIFNQISNKGQINVIYDNSTNSSVSTKNIYYISNNLIVGHWYYIDIKKDNLSGFQKIRYGNIASVDTNVLNGGKVVQCTTNASQPTMHFEVLPNTTTTGSIYPIITDLTVMFGAGNEPATIEEFKTLYPDAYYEYNAGELRSMTATGIRTVGFNQWDEEWATGYINATTGELIFAENQPVASKNYIKVLPNTDYYFKLREPRIAFYDADKNFIECRWVGTGNSIQRTPANCHYIRFSMYSSYGETYLYDGCINLSHTGYRNGEYAPYEVHTRELPEVFKYFPNGMHRVGEVFDEINSENAIQRCGIRDYASGDDTDTSVLTDGARTVYVLPEPIVTSIAKPIQLDYWVEDFGTEEMLHEEPSAPFRADIVYQFNAEGRIRDNGRNIEKLEDDAIVTRRDVSALQTAIVTKLPLPSVINIGGNILTWDSVNKSVSDTGKSFATSLQDFDWNEPDTIPNCDLVQQYVAQSMPTAVATATERMSTPSNQLEQHYSSIYSAYIIECAHNVVTEITPGNSVTGNFIFKLTDSGAGVKFDNVWKVRFSGSPSVSYKYQQVSNTDLIINWEGGIAPPYIEGGIFEVTLRQFGGLWLGEWKLFN